MSVRERIKKLFSGNGNGADDANPVKEIEDIKNGIKEDSSRLIDRLSKVQRQLS